MVVLVVQMRKVLWDTQLAAVLKVLMVTTSDSNSVATMVASVVDLVVADVVLDTTVDSVDSEDHEVAAMVLVDVRDDHPEDSEDHRVMMDCSL